MTKIAVGACAVLLMAATFGSAAVAQQNAAGQALQRAMDRTCVIEINSPGDDRIRLQNICFNPRAVRIRWADGRIFDYCLNSGGDVRYISKLSDEYRMVREQDILLCY